MVIKVLRFSGNKESTTSLVFIDGKFECYGLEDEQRTVKVFGETRIPNGLYQIGLRTVGGHHQRYSDKFKWHEGMLHILDVPDFEYILIHIGNTDDDTAGCLLVGDTINNNTVNDGFLGSSTSAYTRLYKKVIKALNSGEKVSICYDTI